jgi:ABC-type uncharacterized transport system involved in gliding motility auxiliary subunit
MTTANKNQLQTFLFSTAGVGVMLVILLALYVIAGTFKHRVDLTQEKLYTLSAGTKAILEKVRKSDTPIQIHFYCTQDSKEMPVQLKTYAQRVEELLGEYRKAAKGNIEIKKFDPKPDTEAEDSANLEGVQGQALGGGLGLGDKVYLGLFIHQLDSKEVIPFLAPDREKLLEYDISRAIARVTTPEKPVIGVMSPLQVFGEFNPMAMRMGQMQRQDPWIFIQELKSDFDVKQVDMGVDEVPSEVKVLIVIHPKNISSKAQYAIDQFVLKGGKLIAFLDPLSIVDSRNAPPGMNPLQAAQMGGSTMETLLKAWGISFDVNKVVADLNFSTKINQQGRVQSAPAVLSMNKDAMNPDDVVTSQTDNVLIPFSGAFSGTPAEGLKQTVLIHTTKQSQMIDRFMAEFSGDQTAKDFSPSLKEQPIAIRLTGKFKTAFPEGKPKDTTPKPDEEKKEEKKDEKADTASLKESKGDGTVILVGDSDLIFDQFCAQVQNFFGQKIVQLPNGNLPLAQSMVEQLAGDNNLIAVRSRATMNRPFTVVRQMQAEAQDRYRAKISDLEKSLQETQTKLNELQRTKQGESNQRFVLSPDQQEEIKKFHTKQAEVNKELRTLRRSLNKEIDSLETRLKWLNIAGMPVLVAISGISLAFVKRKKTAAK